MAETMEQHMSKTQADYGSGVARPKIEDKDNFELKAQFLKELRTNTFSGSDDEDANEHIEKVFEIVDSFHIPNITIEQVMLRAFPIFKEIGNYKATAPGFYQRNNAQPFHNRRRQSLEDLLANFWGIGTKKRHEENSNLIKEIQASMDATIRNQGASIKTLEIQIKKMSKVLWERGFRSLASLTNTKPEKTMSSYSRNVESGASFDTRMGSTKARIPWTEQYTDIRETQDITIILDYIELNDLNVPLALRRDQVDDLMPTIEEGEVVEEFRARNDARIVSKFFRYPSGCDHDKKIYFAVLEDMDAYRDEGIGDVIFGKPFLREIGINAVLTDLAAKKLTMLVKYLQSGNIEVLESLNFKMAIQHNLAQ
ncbi:hypothetical protein Tco_0715737 [Tanacetum coccineum]